MTHELEEYVLGHIDEEPGNLQRLYRDSNISLLNGRMCSGHLQGRLLKMLMRMIKPRRVLELGTFSGYSALCMAEGLDDGAFIDSVEADDELEDFIREHFKEAECSRRIRLHIADALEFCREAQPDTYDVAFIDADKRDYTKYYTVVKPLVKPGGFIIADNTLWYGHVIETDAARDAQTRGIIAFNDLVAADSEVEKVMLPIRDGLTLIRKKP